MSTIYSIVDKLLAGTAALAVHHFVLALLCCAAFLYGLWFLTVRYVLLRKFPLAVLRWNESLGELNYKLPSLLGEGIVPLSKLLLIGLYHYHPRVMEAWVSRYASKARANLKLINAFRERRLYVPLPVAIQGTIQSELKPEQLRIACSEYRWRLLLKGEGGLGKTTHAARIAQWALEPMPTERLCPQRQMLPVVLDSSIKFDVRKDISTFKKAALAALQELIAPETPIPVKLFDKLLEDRRVLIILDGLSEMPASPVDPSIASLQNPDFPANALLVTSRSEANEFAPTLVIEPCRIDTNHLLPFINKYLAEAGRIELTDSQLIDASRRLADLVTMETGITPLLARLFAEQLAALQRSAMPISDLPRSVPDLMLAYLSTINRDRGSGDLANPDLHKAAQIAAWACVGETLQPGQPGQKVAIRNALSEAGLDRTVLERLENQIKIVSTVLPVESHVQFSLDSLAEYLAALHLVEDLAADKQRWSRFM